MKILKIKEWKKNKQQQQLFIKIMQTVNNIAGRRIYPLADYLQVDEEVYKQYNNKEDGRK